MNLCFTKQAERKSLYWAHGWVYAHVSSHSFAKEELPINRLSAGKLLKRVILLDGWVFKTVAQLSRAPLEKKPTKQTVTQQVIWPWWCHQSLQQRAVWGIWGTWLLMRRLCGFTVVRPRMTLWRIGRGYPLLVSIVLSGLVGWAVRHSHRVGWAYCSSKGDYKQAINGTLPKRDSYNNFGFHSCWLSVPVNTNSCLLVLKPLHCVSCETAV